MKRRRDNLKPWDALYHVPPGTRSIVDIGCNVGELLEHASRLGIEELYGIDINPRAAASARERLSHLGAATVVHGSADRLPFNDGSAQVAVCSEVLEHIPDELRPGAIKEVHRVLKQQGTFIVTVPFKGIFTFLDPANWRLRLPRLYRTLARTVGGEGREAGLDGQKHGIVWHKHFTTTELRNLLEPFFEITLIRWRGTVLAPACEWVLFPFYRTNRTENRFFRWVKTTQDFDYSLSLGSALAYNVLVVSRKK